MSGQQAKPKTRVLSTGPRHLPLHQKLVPVYRFYVHFGTRQNILPVLTMRKFCLGNGLLVANCFSVSVSDTISLGLGLVSIVLSIVTVYVTRK
jgi:hypothetical protein